MHDKIEIILKALRGFVRLESLPFSSREGLLSREREYTASSLCPFANLGIETALTREWVYVLLKTGNFRPPPSPTVLMVEESDDSDGPYCITFGEKSYRVIGEELFDSKKEFKEETCRISDTFLMFPARRKAVDKPALFILPPILFPELEKRKIELGIKDIVSASPCSTADDYLRDICSLSQNKELGTLIVSFNRV
jgi:hypothetical protein